MKKLMSKLVAFALVATLAFALTGCFVTPNTSITFNKYPYGTYAEGTSVETALSAIEVTLTENGEVVKSGTLLALRDEGLVVVEGFNLAEKGANKTAKIVFGTAVVTFTYSVVGTISEDGSVAGEISVNGNVYSENGVYVSEAGDHILKLNTNTISVAELVGSWVAGGNLAISNGTIDARESAETIAVYAATSGSVTLTDVRILTAGGMNPIQCYGGKMVLNNVTSVQTGLSTTPWYNSALQIVNYYKDFNHLAEVTVNGGMYSGKKAIQMSSPGGTLIINSGTFIGEEAIHADYHKPYAEQGATHSITINGGNFDGVIFIAEGVECIINGGTFSFDPATGIIAKVDSKGKITYNTYANITINGTVVDNGNGTWTVVPATPAE